jgi:hypothetical protein
MGRHAKRLGWLSLALGLPAVAAPHTLGRLIGTGTGNGVLQAVGVRELIAAAGLLAQPQQATPWLWSRVGGDAMDIGLLLRALWNNPKQRHRIAGVTGAVIAIAILDWQAARTVQSAE